MQEKTDLSKVKDVAEMLLMTDVCETSYSPMVVQHPFTSSGMVGVRTGGELEILDITENPDNLRLWREQMRRIIEKADSAYLLYLLVNKPYGLTFLKLAEPYLSRNDLSKILSSAWIMSENPKDEFEKAQQLIAKRQDAFPKEPSSETMFSKRIFCADCGSSCRRKNVGTQIYWVCGRHKQGKAMCPTKGRSEKLIREAICRFYQKIWNGRDTILRPVLWQLRELQERELKANQRIGEIDAEIAKLTDQNLVLTRLKSKGYMDSDLYLSQM